MRILLPFLALICLASLVRADATDDSFAAKLDLAPLQALTIQHRQTLKTFDSYARQALYEITGRSSYEGKDAVFTVLDMSFVPQKYIGRNMIKIRNVPLRQDFQLLRSIDTPEKDRILKEGTISLRFWMQPEVRQLMREQMSSAAFKAKAIQQVFGAASEMMDLVGHEANFPPIALIASPPGKNDDKKWRRLGDIAGNVPAWSESIRSGRKASPVPVSGYDSARLEPVVSASAALMSAWVEQNASLVNDSARKLGDLLPQINPSVYPSQLKRKIEVVYNRLTKLTLPGAALYFIAFACFLVSCRSGFEGVRLWGLRLMILAFAVHTIGIAVRWWLVSTTHGNWFDGIPIKNQFESVVFSAWFGAMVGLTLELFKQKGFFGAAASFVGWLSMTALFAMPYVAGVQVTGEEIGQVQGVLMSYWLYIHVTMVTASYALIGMSFLLGIWWLVKYYGEYGTLRRVSARLLSADGLPRAEREEISMMGGAGVLRAGVAKTLLRLLFFPQARAKTHSRPAPASEVANASELFLARLDMCNLVVLQLAFWVLGVGIILGAVWADQSWGRPWGWDPKETFALVTWIVYLIVVHTRVATADKAWWTAVLSIIGFFVMLFNWIGVNFFLVGLHSYA